MLYIFIVCYRFFDLKQDHLDDNKVLPYLLCLWNATVGFEYRKKYLRNKEQVSYGPHGLKCEVLRIDNLGTTCL